MPLSEGNLLQYCKFKESSDFIHTKMWSHRGLCSVQSLQFPRLVLVRLLKIAIPHHAETVAGTVALDGDSAASQTARAGIFTIFHWNFPRLAFIFPFFLRVKLELNPRAELLNKINLFRDKRARRRELNYDLIVNRTRWRNVKFVTPKRKKCDEKCCAA